MLKKTITTEPTNEQLANFACALILGPGYSKTTQHMVKTMFDDISILREQWLQHHAKFQKKANELTEEISA